MANPHRDKVRGCFGQPKYKGESDPKQQASANIEIGQGFKITKKEKPNADKASEQSK